MIQLNRYTKKAREELVKQVEECGKRPFTLRQLLLFLTRKWCEMDDAFLLYLDEENERRRQNGDGTCATHYELFQELAADLIVLLIGFLRYSGIRDVEKLLNLRLEGPVKAGRKRTKDKQKK